MAGGIVSTIISSLGSIIGGIVKAIWEKISESRTRAKLEKQRRENDVLKARHASEESAREAENDIAESDEDVQARNDEVASGGTGAKLDELADFTGGDK